MTNEVKRLLRKRNTAFRSGDKELYSSARADLRRSMKKAKEAYKKTVEDHLANKDPRRMWQGIQQLTNYKGNTVNCSSHADASLAEELNHFFSRFEADRPATDLPPPLQTSTTHRLTLQEHQVRRVLKAVNPRKATGPDGVPGRVLNYCADQLTGVFTRIFNTSLLQATVPSCLKSSTIIPVPKKTASKDLNSYRPVALTPVVMKCFEKLISQHIRSSLPATFDSHQFAYRPNRSTEDTIVTATHTALSHLGHRSTCVRMLFVDFRGTDSVVSEEQLGTEHHKNQGADHRFQEEAADGASATSD